jgi:DNA-binding FadR family transcriptional regulator
LENPVQPDRLYRRVADQLVALIRDGVYKLGEKLPAERDLAETFGVSRPSVREAMIALEILGVVEIRDRSGIYVIQSEAALHKEGTQGPSGREDLNVGAFELVEARILIEGETAALAAPLVKQKDLDILGNLIQEMQTDDATRCEEADRAFHIHIASITDNGALIDAIEHLWNLRTQSPLASQIMTRAQGGGREARLAEHEGILNALASRNPVLARRAMRVHLESVREYLLDATETAEMDALKKKFQSQRLKVTMRTLSGTSTD